MLNNVKFLIANFRYADIKLVIQKKNITTKRLHRYLGHASHYRDAYACQNNRRKNHLILSIRPYN